jgi:hypothetical protein
VAFRDFWSGWVDGRRGLPVVTANTRGPVLIPTGHMLAAWALSGQRMDDRYRALVSQTADDRVEYASAEPRRNALTVRIEEYSDRLVQLVEAGPTRERRLGEQNLPDSHVTRRRAGELERRKRHLRKEITEARNELVALETRQLHVEARIQVALSAALGDANVIGAQADRRVASYLKGACRTHPDPQTVAAASADLRRPEPAWLNLASAQDLMSTVEEDGT